MKKKAQFAGKKQKTAGSFIFLMVLIILCGCAARTRETDTLVRGQEETDMPPQIGLVLTSEDAEENEALISGFQEAAAFAGAGLLVKIPQVTEAEASQAASLTGSFVLCEVDPIEYQMFLVNDLVAEDVDVIAIHANHSEALEPVLSAARAVGIRVCAFGREVAEESCDVYAGTEDAPQSAVELLGTE